MDAHNYLTIDVEDFYQVSAFEPLVAKESWPDYPSRVEENTARILDILAAAEVKATFFILGWTAEQFPGVVRSIAAGGHEIGCHSYLHRLVYDLTPEEFFDDTRRAKDILEQITGRAVRGYRAPSYSITANSLWALPILKELDFTFDSSIFPIHHDRYGLPAAPRYPFAWDLSGETPVPGEALAADDEGKATDGLSEYPISTALFFGRKVPVSGGGYFRLFPYWFTRLALRRINRREGRRFIFYLHPWEFDPAQPRFSNAGALSRFRHYINLDKTSRRFTRLLKDFPFGPMHVHPDQGEA